MIIISKYLVPRGYVGITIFPFVLLKFEGLRGSKTLLNHEKIHLKQQIELLIVPFFIIYVIEFLIKLVTYRNWDLAYKNISFEREAYANEKDLDYLKSKSFYSFVNYFIE
nr:hypothetical protein [uncultured Winogradskyella sp.]